MIERKFIEKGTQKSEMEKYLNKTLERADYSHSDIKRTPLNTRIVIYAGRPGVVIGHAGTKINEMTNDLKRRFNIDNPQIEVKSVEHPSLDAKVVAKQIASSLERGTKHRQIVNIMLKKIIEAGAIGAEITVSGKITGSRSRTEKFMLGYLKKCGNTADVHTQTEIEKATLKAGTIGIKVKLMSTMPSVLSIEKRILETAKEKEDEEKAKKQKKEETKPEPSKEKPKAKEPEPKEEKSETPKEKQKSEDKDKTKKSTDEPKKTEPKQDIKEKKEDPKK
ncbi:MAG: 30S ribosomal protein S3 [Candidatus Aenigmarchaeota archaeon]|nr:30S ribosomal protein S3 [Candidatus Aenigmarchaeota archaeon]